MTTIDPLQEVFLELDVMQCGYCTPGMILSGMALLAQNPDPSEAEIVQAMQGTIRRANSTNPLIPQSEKEVDRIVRMR